MRWRAHRQKHWVFLAAGSCLAFGCDNRDSPQAELPPLAPVESAGPGQLVRLNASQLRDALEQLFGPVETGIALEPDRASSGLRQLGSATQGLSAWGVEQYESLLLNVGTQAVDPMHRARWMPCSEATENCFDSAVESLAERAWRRKPLASEIAPFQALHREAFVVIQDRYEALSYAVAGVLQSPSFLYRFEVGSGLLETPALATRLSFFLNNSPPDSLLLARVMDGSLSEPLTYQQEVERLSASAASGMLAFFEDMYRLYELRSVTKDAQRFPFFATELPEQAGQEMLLFLEDSLWNRQIDFRNVFEERLTFVNRRLAALYGVKAPAQEGFAAVVLPPTTGRKGLLGQASLLMLNSHPAASSATLRGQFVREVLLCGRIPPPPSGVDTSLPEPTSTAPTLRDRVREHLENPECAGCHQLMDPVGLGLEQFDSVGRFRSTEGGALIDPSGNLDGSDFSDALELGTVLSEHPSVPGCLVRTLYRYAVSRDTTPSEEPLLQSLRARFQASGYRIPQLMVDIALSEGFQKVEVK